MRPARALDVIGKHEMLKTFIFWVRIPERPLMRY